MSKIVSENFRNKMLKLSGVDLQEEDKKAYLKLIQEHNFLQEKVIEEGAKTLAIAVLSLLSVLTASSQDAKNGLLKINLKNHNQVEHFKKDLASKLKPEQLNSKDFKDFSTKLTELEKEVGTHTRHEGVVTHYTNVFVKETNLSFDLTNPQSKKNLDAIIAQSKQSSSSFLVSIDTVKQMVSKVTPAEEVKLNQKVKIANQTFKGYNEFKADESVVDSIAQQIIKTFEGYKNVYGYIQVNGSASHVPTTAFNGNNESLAQARACALAQQLQEKLPENLANKIVVDYKVDGPEYEHDANNTAKYAPFQFSNVDIHLTAVKSLPVVASPEKVIVNVKLMNASMGAEQRVAQTIMKAGKSGGKGSVKTSCPIKTFNK